MKHQYHSGSPNEAAGKEAAKVRELINEFHRRVRILESDIAREEELARVSNPFNAAYPVLARMITARRDNLKQTIAALEQRLPPELARTA
jgi:phage shock protein A